MLGKGLESLIPNKNETAGAPVTIPAPASFTAPVTKPVPIGMPARLEPREQSAESVFHIEVEKIKPNPYQPRKNFDEVQLQELSASIREFGIIQPLIVSKIEKETPQGTGVEYQLIAGERRLMAAKMLGLPRVPAIVRAVPEEKEKFEMAIVENIQRADLNPIETARSYAKLQEQFGLTQREIAARIGKSRETIANVVRLLNLPTEMQDAIAQNKISESQGRVLLAIVDPLQQRYLFEQVTQNNISVRELKNTIARMNRPVAQTMQAAVMQPGSFVQFAQENEYAGLVRELEEMLKTPVSIEKSGAQSKLTITVSSAADLHHIIEKLLTK